MNRGKPMRAKFTMQAASAGVFLTTLVCNTAFAATITVLNTDGASEGFNDPTPIVPVGGNPATTLGQARLLAFQRAASLWAARLFSAVEIKVEAQMNPLSCSFNGAVIGNAGPSTIDRDFPGNDPTYGAPVSNTWYPQALANAMAGFDRTASQPEVSAEFNSVLGLGGCTPGTNWYYGFDANAPSGSLDFVSVVFHELGHGLGFSSFVDLSTGEELVGRDDTFSKRLSLQGGNPSAVSIMTNAQRLSAFVADPNLVWGGTAVAAATPQPTAGRTNGQVRMHAPNPVQFGSSVGHFSSAVFPNELMEPFYAGPNHNPGLALAVMQDIGWIVTPAQTSNVPSGSRWGVVIAALGLLCLGALALGRRYQSTPQKAVISTRAR